MNFFGGGLKFFLWNVSLKFNYIENLYFTVHRHVQHASTFMIVCMYYTVDKSEVEVSQSVVAFSEYTYELYDPDQKTGHLWQKDRLEKFQSLGRTNPYPRLYERCPIFYLFRQKFTSSKWTYIYRHNVNTQYYRSLFWQSNQPCIKLCRNVSVDNSIPIVLELNEAG